jgi:outer membrane protein TolC
MLEEQERMLKTSLAHLTGQDSDVFGEFAHLPELPLDKSVSEIYILARANSLTVKALEAAVQEMEAEVKRKELDKYPDFTISAGYEPRFSEMDDIWTVGVSFNLPLYYDKKQKPAADSARAKKYKADTLLADKRHELRSMITEFVASAEAAERIMEIYKDGVIGKSRLLRDSALAGYRQGMMPAAEAVTAVNTSIEYEIKYLNQNAQRQKKLSALNTLTGGTLYGTQIPE